MPTPEQQIAEIRTIVGDILTIVNGALGGAGGGWVGANFNQVKGTQAIHTAAHADTASKLIAIDEQVQ